jgi:hypothetical protein
LGKTPARPGARLAEANLFIPTLETDMFFHSKNGEAPFSVIKIKTIETLSGAKVKADFLSLRGDSSNKIED